MKTALLSLALALALGGCAHHERTLHVSADAQTEPMATVGDVADDPAIWIHPSDPYQSLIIGTHKKGGGLEVYDLSGKRIQSLPDGRFNNVDLRNNVHIGDQSLSIVAATKRDDDTLALYAIDAQTRQLYPIAERSIETIKENYGLCMYQEGDQTYVFVNNKFGTVEQLELFEHEGKVDAKRVRLFEVGSQTEGCVADDELGALYIGEEDVGIWRYDAKADAPAHRVLIDSTGKNGHLVADVEGLALYTMEGGSGYLFASSQGEHAYNVYNRQSGLFLGKFTIDDDVIDGAQETDGLDVTAANIGVLYPYGFLVVQDGHATPSNTQNFKIIRIEKILAPLSSF